MIDINKVQEKLQELQKLDRRFELFGASTHRYRFNNPMEKDKLIQVFCKKRLTSI